MQWTISTTTFKHMERTREQQLVWKNTHLLGWPRFIFKETQQDTKHLETDPSSGAKEVNGTKGVRSKLLPKLEHRLLNKQEPIL